MIRLGSAHPECSRQLADKRPLLNVIKDGEQQLEQALDAERRELIHRNEERLHRYMSAAEPWAVLWPKVASAIEGLALKDAHEVVVSRAEGVLPFQPV